MCVRDRAGGPLIKFKDLRKHVEWFLLRLWNQATHFQIRDPSYITSLSLDSEGWCADHMRGKLKH